MNELLLTTLDSAGYVPDLTLIGRRYKHFKGGTYIIIGFIWDATRDEWNINYCSTQASEITFSRTPVNFFEKERFIRYK